ncbi:MAG: DUF1326 domain-containing protein [Nitrososphaeraceae archaeon]
MEDPPFQSEHDDIDGVDIILAQSWPKAIHEGNGTVLLLITNKANDEQRKAIIQIVSGQAREIVLHYLQVHLAVFWNHSLLISMLK